MPPLDPPAPAPLAVIPSAELSSLDAQPAAVYLAQLTTRSRRTQRSALDAVAALLGYADALACPWSSLRYAHTAAIRAALA